MTINNAKYIISSPSLELCPPETFNEFAFIGRSNVGKSSLINYLTNNGNLAKVSKTPGKTKLINHFLINNEWFLVDLPGYGYAKTSKENREIWGKFIEDYILGRSTLKTLFVLVDGRIPPQAIDINFLSWLRTSKIPVTVIITKIDKVSQKELHQFTTELHSKINKNTIILTASAMKKIGKEKILDRINTLLR
jgi:GTP-binding protein